MPLNCQKDCCSPPCSEPTHVKDRPNQQPKVIGLLARLLEMKPPAKRLRMVFRQPEVDVFLGSRILASRRVVLIEPIGPLHMVKNLEEASGNGRRLPPRGV